MPSDERAPYDVIAARFNELRSGFVHGERAYVDLALEGVRPGGRVLDVGCGTGRPHGAYVASRGFAVVGVDRSRAMLGLARRHVAGGRWVEGDLTAVPFGAGTFDAAICWDAMFHLPRERFGAVLRGVFECLKPGGRVALTCGAPAAGAEAFRDTMFGESFFYDALPRAEMLNLIEGVGFEVLLAAMINEPDGGRDRGRLGIVGRRRRDSDGVTDVWLE